MREIFDLSRQFIYRGARPLDFARWRFHFEGGPKTDVLEALSHYQNEDGGFGHALEPDCWNPFSSPIQTWAATEILHEIGFHDSAHPLVAGILKYLESGKDFDGHYWHNTVESNNNFPHAPWWHAGSDSASHHDYNPTACLAGFILLHAEPGSALYTLGFNIAGEALSALISQGTIHDMHTLLCYIRLLQYVQQAAGPAPFSALALKRKLIEQVSRCISPDKSAWSDSYVCMPSQFIDSRDSIFYASNQELADAQCGHIIRTQLEDGTWPVNWAWADYPDAWAVSKIWWKSAIIIKNILYLRDVGSGAAGFMPEANTGAGRTRERQV